MNAAARFNATLLLGLVASVWLVVVGPREQPGVYWNFAAGSAWLGAGLAGVLAAWIASRRFGTLPRGTPWTAARRRAVDLAVFAIGFAICLRWADTARGGDFDRVVYDITHGVWLIKAEPLSPAMMLLLAKLADALGMAPLPGLRFGLALWGGLGFVALRHLAWALASDEPHRGALGFAALASAGSNALLFAHVETYTFSGVAMIFALAWALRAAHGGRTIYAALAAYTLACAFHLQMLCLGPAIVWAAWHATRAPDARPGRRGVVFACLASGALLLALQPLCAAFPTPYPQYFGGGDGRMLVPAERLLSRPHLAAVANELWLMGAGALVVSVGLVAGFRPRALSRSITGLAWVGWVLFLFAWNPDLGAWRDWDLFAAVGWWGSAFAVASCVDESEDPRAPWLLLLAAGLNASRSFPFILENHLAGL